MIWCCSNIAHRFGVVRVVNVSVTNSDEKDMSSAKEVVSIGQNIVTLTFIFIIVHLNQSYLILDLIFFKS
jgi:hypothetical protein